MLNGTINFMMIALNLKWMATCISLSHSNWSLKIEYDFHHCSSFSGLDKTCQVCYIIWILLSGIAASEIEIHLYDYVYVCSYLTKCVTPQTDDWLFQINCVSKEDCCRS